MKPIAYLLVFSFSFSSASAQQPDTATVNIYYTLRHMTDSASPTVFRQENMVLYIGDQMNIFLSYDKIKRDSALKASGYNNATAQKNSNPVINTQIISDKINRQLVIQEYLFRHYYYTIPYPVIDWTITTEKKQVAGYSCIRAEGYYKGRVYHAWFTTQAKLEGAPWKLQGLPGLVLEAYDTRKQIIFEFNKMETVTGHDHSFIITTPPAYVIKTTKKDFYRMREAAWNDAVDFINSENTETGIQINISSGNGNTGSIRLQKPLNPFELIDD